MELTNMKVSEESKNEYSSTAVADSPPYPYGLCVSLDEVAIKKLTLPALPAAGQSMLLYARVYVNSVVSIDRSEGGKDRRIELQITDMALAPDQKKSDPAASLYSGNE